MVGLLELIYTAAWHAGLLQPCLWRPPDDRPPISTMVGVQAPDVTVLDQLAVGTDTTITFPTTALPGLTRGEVVEVDGVSYRVRDLRAVGDGSEIRASLTRL